MAAVFNPCSPPKPAGVKQPVHWFLVGRIVDIQQGTNVWVGSPPPSKSLGLDKILHKLSYKHDKVDQNIALLY
jgi:hypothetical protein